MDLDLEERIRDLASTRSDGIPAKKRKELMAEVTTSLQTSASDREILANLKGTFDFFVAVQHSVTQSVKVDPIVDGESFPLKDREKPKAH